jgi:RecJ-like exonuclease
VTTACPNCDGDGHHYVAECPCHDDRESNCPDVSSRRVVCEECGGTGAIPVEEEE